MTRHVPPSRSSDRRKLILFRVCAVVLGLAPMLLAESACRFAGWGEAREIDDPFVGFSSLHPLFELNDTGDRFEIAESRRAYFRPDGFAATKGPNEFRVFCLGGSTVQGRPYAIETSFTTWLELSLKAASPDRTWRVVNCGGISYASYRLAPILQELLEYEPDLFILYTGHNEFLEDRTYEDIKNASKVVNRLHAFSSRFRTINVARAWWTDLWGGDNQPRQFEDDVKAELPAEVDALLDYRGGLEDYHRDEAWREGTVAHYRFNLLRMVRMAQLAGVPMILMNPVSNLKECPPFKFLSDENLSAGDRDRFDAIWARAQEETDPRTRIALLQQATEIDPRHAGAHYLLGTTCFAANESDRAKKSYIRAKDEDICPLRMIEPLYDALANVASQTNTPLVDVRGLFEIESPLGIPGEELMLDHVHPSINGHKMIADLLVGAMAKEGMVSRGADWKARQSEVYARHLDTLDAIYFARGKQRLEGLIRWTQGRTDKLRPGATDDADPE